MYEIVFSDPALKEFYSLEKEIQERIVAVLERIAVSPHRHLRKLSGSPFFRLRVGDYRVILDVNEKIEMLEILKIGKRDSVYL